MLLDWVSGSCPEISDYNISEAEKEYPGKIPCLPHARIVVLWASTPILRWNIASGVVRYRAVYMGSVVQYGTRGILLVVLLAKEVCIAKKSPPVSEVRAARAMNGV